MIDFEVYQRIHQLQREGLSHRQIARQLGLRAETVAKWLATRPRVIILDEPTAALSNAEKRILFEQVKALKALGISFIYISHHLDEVFEVADTVTILRDGLVVKEREEVGNLNVELIADLMMGEKTERSVRVDHCRADAAPLLQAKGVGIYPLSDQDIDFQIQPGEIVAFAGPVGGGKEALADGDAIRRQRNALRGNSVWRGVPGAMFGRGLHRVWPQAGGGGLPSDSVRTSKPSAVTSTVCSHCAERLWSLVTMVQPSAIWRISGRPALIIGSTVKIMPSSSFMPMPGLP